MIHHPLKHNRIKVGHFSDYDYKVFDKWTIQLQYIKVSALSMRN